MKNRIILVLLSLAVSCTAISATPTLLDRMNAGATPREAITAESSYQEGVTIEELASAMGRVDPQTAALLLVYASEMHPQRTCKYIERLTSKGDVGKVVHGSVIAAQNESRAYRPMMRCLAKDNEPVAKESFMAILAAAPEQAEMAIAFFAEVNPELAAWAQQVYDAFRADEGEQFDAVEPEPRVGEISPS